MSSDIDICNQALAEFGGEAITALTDANNKARYCARFYAPARDWLLRSYDWNFASNKATLVVLAAAPAFDYLYAYTLPTLPYCLAVRELFEGRPVEGGSDYAVVGRTLETDSTVARIRYTAKITDPTTFDAMFEQALVRLLVLKLTKPLGGSAADKELALKEFQAAIEQAQEADAIEQYQDEEDRGPIIDEDGEWITDRL